MSEPWRRVLTKEAALVAFAATAAGVVAYALWGRSPGDARTVAGARDTKEPSASVLAKPDPLLYAHIARTLRSTDSTAASNSLALLRQCSVLAAHYDELVLLLPSLLEHVLERPGRPMADVESAALVIANIAAYPGSRPFLISARGARVVEALVARGLELDAARVVLNVTACSDPMVVRMARERLVVERLLSVLTAHPDPRAREFAAKISINCGLSTASE